MKNKIYSIISIYNIIKNYSDLIFDKQNDILSCIKSLEQEGVSLRQKKAADALMQLQKRKEKEVTKLKELLKSLDIESYNNKYISSKLLSECFYSTISKDNLNILKQLYKNL